MRKKIKILIIIALAFILNTNVVEAEVLTVNGSHSNEGELGTNHYTTNINGKSVDLYCKDPGLELPINEPAVYEVTPISPNTKAGAGLIALMEKSKKDNYTFEQINIAIRFYEYVMGQVNVLLTRSQVEKQYEDEFGPIYLVLKNLETAEHYVNRWKNRDDFGTKVNSLTVITFDSYRNAFLNEIKNKGYNGRTDWSSSNIGGNEEKVYELVKAGIDAAYDFANGDSSSSTNTSFELSHKSEPEDNSKEGEYYKKTITYSFKYEGFEYDFDNPDDEDNDSILFTFKCDECDSNADVDYTITINNDESMKITKGDNTKDIELFGNDAYIRTNETDTLTMIIEFTVKKGSDYNCDDKLKYTLDFRYTGEPASDYALYMPTCEKADGSIMSTCIQQELVGDAWQEEVIEPEFGGSIGGGNTSSGEDNDDDKYKGKFTQEDEISMCDGDCDELAQKCELPDGTIDTSKEECKDYEEKCKKKCTVHVSDATCSPSPTEMKIYEGAEAETPCEDAKINVYKCVIDGKDINEKEYNQVKTAADDWYSSKYSSNIQFLENTAADDNNPFCKVACIENYNIELPPEKEVTSGRYFQLETRVAGKKACYTSEINKGNYRDPEEVWYLDSETQKKEKESFEYKFETARETMMAARTTYSLLNDAFKADTKIAENVETGKHVHAVTAADGCYYDETYPCNCVAENNCSTCTKTVYIHKTPIPIEYYKYDLTSEYTEYNYLYHDDINVDSYLPAREFIAKFNTGFYIADENGNGKYSKFTPAADDYGQKEFAEVNCENYDAATGKVKCKVSFYGTAEIVLDANSHYWDKKPVTDLSTKFVNVLKAAIKDDFKFNYPQQNYLKYYPDNFKPKSAVENIADAQRNLNEFINSKYEEMNRYVKQINQCSHWSMGNYNFDPQIKFDYEESYINNDVVRKQLEAKGNSVNPEIGDLELCGALLTQSNQDGELPKCDKKLSGEEVSKDRKTLICRSGTDCTKIETYVIPNSVAASQVATVEREYETPTQYAVLFPTGNVVVSPNKLGDIDKANELEHAWPVDWTGSGVVRTYRLYVQDLGEFYNTSDASGKNKLGRTWDSGPSGEPKETSIVGKVAENPDICEAPIGTDKDHRWDIVPGTSEYICGYKINCPNCPSECVPNEEGGECRRDTDDCPSGDCPSPCEGICIMNGDLQLESRPISENKINTSNRTMGPNWRWDTNIDSAIELKAYQATKEIEEAGEDIFNVAFDASYEGSTTLQDTGQMLVHLDRKTINEIKEYNKSNLFTDDSLKCYDYTNDSNGEIYKGIFCYSTFIDKYINKTTSSGKKIITVSGTRPLDEGERKNSQGSGYWTTWDKVVSNSPKWEESTTEINLIIDPTNLDFKTIKIGPAYK